MLQDDLTRPTDLFEKFIQPNCGRHQDCPRCKILKQKNFISQDKYYTDMSKNITREPKGDGTYHIRADFVLADTPEKLFPKSNLKEAMGTVGRRLQRLTNRDIETNSTSRSRIGSTEAF